MVARLAYFDEETLDGPSAEVLLVPEAELPTSDARVAELAARARALGVEDLDRPLTESLGLTELTGDLDSSVSLRFDGARERAAKRAAGCGWKVPRELVALAALLDGPTSWETAALEYLSFRPTPWLEAIFASEAARAEALRMDREAFPRHPPEFVHLFSMHANGCSYGYRFEAPAGFAEYHAGHAELSKVTPCAFIADAARRAAEEPDLGALTQLERLSLEEAARYFDAAQLF